MNRILGLYFLSILPLFGQPVISAALNGASYVPPSLRSGKLAQGSLVTIFGSKLGPTAVITATALPLPTQGLGGSVVAMESSAGRQNLSVLYASATQVGVVLPETAPIGAVKFTVSFAGEESRGFDAEIVRSAPGLFAVNQRGTGPGIVQNFLSSSQIPMNTIFQKARPQQVATLWATGLGSQSSASDSNLRLYVGNRQARILYQGKSGCCVGVDQINFVVPEGAVGCYVPMQVVADGATSNTVTMAIGESGDQCTDPRAFPRGELDKPTSRPLRTGEILLRRNNLYLGSGMPPPARSLSDTATAVFALLPPSEVLGREDAFEYAPAGTCSIQYGFREISAFSRPRPPQGLALDIAQTLTLSSATGPERMNSLWTGHYIRTGESFYRNEELVPAPLAAKPFLDPGTMVAVTANGATAAGNGQISATLRFPPAFQWVNRNDIEGVDRDVDKAKALTVRWSGMPEDATAIISGTFVGSVNKEVAVFHCYENAKAGSFTVPAYILANLPDTEPVMVPGIVFNGSATLTVGALGPTNTFAATDLDSKKIFYYINESIDVRVR